MEEVDVGFTLEVTDVNFKTDSEVELKVKALSSIEDVQSVFESANFGFMYNPIRQSFECQRSTGIPAMVGYHYPFKLPEQKDEE